MKWLNIFLILFFVSNNFAQALKEKAENQLKSQFPDHKIEFKKFKIPELVKKELEFKSKQTFFKNEVYLWKITRNDSLIAIALLDNVIGKDLPITFLVLFNDLGTIILTEIIKYRSTRGGDIQDREWLDQFIGLNEESTFQVGNAVDAISGATYSVASITKGIFKLTLLANNILFSDN